MAFARINYDKINKEKEKERKRLVNEIAKKEMLTRELERIKSKVGY